MDAQAGADADREIVTTRVMRAPPERVFKAWTDPDHLAQWWGPKGFTNSFEVFEPRPGGTWRFVMHGPDGATFPNESVFVEVAPERIVLDHLSGHRFRVTATFVPEAGGTRFTFRMTHATAAECAKVKGFAGDANEEMFDRLEAELARMA